MSPRRLLWLSLFLSLSGCGLRITVLGTGASKPSNVALYFQIETFDGDPVAELSDDSFEIYEDDRLVSKFESLQTILNPQVGAVHYTLLLLDLSASVTKAGQLPTVIQVSSAFVDRISKFQKIAVYAFDGRKELIKVADFTDDAEVLKREIGELIDFRPADLSTNLRGATVEGIKLLNERLETSALKLSFGTMVVFTDGTDHASRVSAKTLGVELKKTPIDIFTVGLSGEIDRRELSRIGRKGVYFAGDLSQLAVAFDSVAERIEKLSKRFYLLSYCSPARDGQHELKVKVKTTKKTKIPKGERTLTDTITYKFNAQGFTPRCNPTNPPPLQSPGAAPTASK